VLRAAINPLGLDASRTLVAADPAGAWLGSGQLSRLQRAPWQRPQPPQPPAAPAFELRSLVVAPDRRGEGIGSALVRGLLDMARAEVGGTAAGEAEVFLTTTAGLAPFYSRAGAFGRCALSEAPPLLAAEVAVGTLVAALVARDALVVMRRRLSL
jgi:GNAT superfamily N-acetyltransferase